MLGSWPRSSLHNSGVIDSENLPCPSFPKRGWNDPDKKSPFKKGDKGDLSSGSVTAISLDFFSELLRYLTRTVVKSD
jgi:hypothetical protein